MAKSEWVDVPHDDDWVDVDHAPAAAPERPWYAFDPKNMGSGFINGLEKIDEYTGAPIRKLVTEAVRGEAMEHAPSGAEQAKMMGATDKTYEEMWGLPY